MKVEIQGEDECALATIAALVDKPLFEIRGIFYDHLYADEELIKYFKTWKDIVKSYIAFWGITAFICWYVNLHPSVILGCKRFYEINQLPYIGKGAVSLRYKSFDKGHIAPYENGLIYDSRCKEWAETGVTLEEYLNLNKQAKLNFISIID